MYERNKRILDVTVAGLLLVLALPLLAVIMLCLWIAQKRVLFRQVRPGLRGRHFTLYKFCSMQDAYDQYGNLLPDEQRLTRIGRFLRKTSLDELPQLCNVLKGDMSLIGPRPLLIEYMDRYTPEQARRHDVKPGITGWAQVNGRNAIQWQQKFSLDVWYVDHRSFALDLRILWMTVSRVMFKSGISSEGHATMPKFMGNSREA